MQLARLARLAQLAQLARLARLVRMGLMVQRVRKASRVSKALRVTLATREPQALIQRLPDLLARPDPLAHKGTLVQPDQRATRGQPGQLGPLVRTAMMAP